MNMNDSIPDNAELIALYRSGRASVDGLDAETLLAYAEGGLSAEHKASVAEKLASSPGARALLAMLTELHADSLALADSVATERAGHHVISRRDRRRVAIPIARPRRVAGWFGAIAASALAVIAIFAFHGSQKVSDHQLASDSAARGDQIFAMREDRIFKPEMGRVTDARGGAATDRVFDSSFAKGG